jgi:murein L,D-transpeptidase YafK
MKTITIIALMLILTANIRQNDFLTEQKRYGRVKNSYLEKGQIVTKILKNENITIEHLNILIIAFKEEKLLEIYAKNKNDINYKKIITYDICNLSGKIGPKRKQGDNQVPEGFYHINRFNPESNFYLSLGINYPNQADRALSNAKNPGGDIFIHGSCVTIGCLPMTDDKIKEIYIYAIQARQTGQIEIPVYIFPFKMTEDNMKFHKNQFNSNKILVDFWENLKTGYTKFEIEKKELIIKIDNNGKYTF